MSADLPTSLPNSQPLIRPRLRPFVRLLLLFGALGLALLTQRLIDTSHSSSLLLLVVLVAMGFGWLSWPHQRAATPSKMLPQIERPPLRWNLLGSGIVLALVGYSLLAPKEFTTFGFSAWLAGVVLCLVGLWDGPVPGRRWLEILGEVRQGGVLALPWEWLVLGVILAVGAFYRLHQLADLPGEPAPDIPLKLQIVRGILAGERPIYSTIYPGRETLFFYCTALYAAFFGSDQFALKLVSVLFSLATLPLAYWLASRWFGRGVGLFMAAWLAIAPWHILISRIGYRGVMTPFMIVLTMAVLDQALERGLRRDFALLGLVAGIGFYTYTAYQIVPLAIAIAWLASVGGRWRQAQALSGIKRWLYLAQPAWLLTLLLLLLLLLPLLHFAVNDFDNLFLRSGSRITSREVPLPGDLLGTLTGNLYSSLGMFNLRGDIAYILNVPGRRSLGFVSGALFLLGLGLLLRGILRRPYAIIALFLLVMQLPSALALAFPNEVPAALRASGALIPAYLLIALPLPLLRQAVLQGWRGVLLIGDQTAPLKLSLRWVGQSMLALAVAALLVVEARETYHSYFHDYALVQPYKNYPLNRAIAQALDEYAGEGPAYLRIWPYWSDVNAIQTTLRRMPIGDYKEVEEAQFNQELFASVPQRALFILHPDDQGSIVALRSAFPRGTLVARRDDSGQIAFYTFYAERGD